MSDLSDLVIAARRRPADAKTAVEVVDIITFVQSGWGLDLELYPVQRVILKAHYGLALDDNVNGFPLDIPVPLTHPKYDASLMDTDGFYALRIEVTDFKRENRRFFTEAGYLAMLHEDHRCNIAKVIPGKERREMILSIGRRSGKTLITSCILAYETYKLLMKGNPQVYYGTSQSAVLQLIAVATSQKQAALLYREASGHFGKCAFFQNYIANSTQSDTTFQTPYDIEKYGAFANNSKARITINVTFKSCVATGLRGGANIFVALDEAAHFASAGRASAEDVYKAVEPSTRTFSPKDPKNKTKTIRDKRGVELPNEGRIVMISSPLGKQGLFYKQFRLGFGSNVAADNMLCIEAPTWEVNPTVPAETFVGSYLKDTTAFRTEYGAEFTDRSRGWIEEPSDLLSCIDPAARPRLRAAPRAPHFLGLDVALVGDWSALVVGHNDPNGKVVVDLVERIRAGEGKYADRERLEVEDIVKWVLDISKRFYILDGIFDQHLGVVLEQAFQKCGLSQMRQVIHNKQVSSLMFENFKTLMLDQKVTLYDWPIPAEQEHSDFITELLELQAETLSKYVVSVEAPNSEGKHDDFADALVRMTWVAMKHRSRSHISVGVTPRGGRAVKPGTSTTKKVVRSGSDPMRLSPRDRALSLRRRR